MSPTARVRPKPTFFSKPEDFRAWLAEHHASSGELLVGFHKKGSGHASITWPESVDEALCFGWIDGVRHSLGAHGYTVRFTPRRRTSNWSKVNVARVQKLRAEGRMVSAGLRAFEARKPERTGIYAFENTAASLPLSGKQRLRANADASAFFEAQPAWYQRAAIHWVMSAKREETRARRLEVLIAHSESAQPVPPLAYRSSKRTV